MLHDIAAAAAKSQTTHNPPTTTTTITHTHLTPETPAQCDPYDASPCVPSVLNMTLLDQKKDILLFIFTTIQCVAAVKMETMTSPESVN